MGDFFETAGGVSCSSQKHTLMGDLPRERKTPSRPFDHAGVDFGSGPEEEVPKMVLDDFNMGFKMKASRIRSTPRKDVFAIRRFSSTAL